MKKIILFLFPVILLLAAGCSDSDKVVNTDPPELTVEPITEDLQQIIDLYKLPDDGSYDPNGLNPELDPPDLADTSYDVYAVTLLWGNPLPNTGVAPPAVNWDGSLSVNGVAWVVPVRSIMFEPDEDVLLDNPNQSTSAWTSTTHGFVDGASFLVFLKRGVTYITAPRLTFDTEPIDQAWDFEQLQLLSALYISDAGNILAVHAHKVRPARCPKGLLAGKWLRDRNTPGTGTFEGVWYGPDRQPRGLYVGRYWPGDSGVGRFEGSVSGYYTDEVIAEFHGEWFYTDLALCPTCGDRFGEFKGRVKWLGTDAIGEMWGGFGEDNVDFNTIDQLPMAGFWRINCTTTDNVLPD